MPVIEQRLHQGPPRRRLIRVRVGQCLSGDTGGLPELVRRHKGRRKSQLQLTGLRAGRVGVVDRATQEVRCQFRRATGEPLRGRNRPRDGCGIERPCGQHVAGDPLGGGAGPGQGVGGLEVQCLTRGRCDGLIYRRAGQVVTERQPVGVGHQHTSREQFLHCAQ
jgi:hypothetical protein